MKKADKTTNNTGKRPQEAPAQGGNDKKTEKPLNPLAGEEIEEAPYFCRLCGAILKYNGLGEYKCPDCNHSEYDSYGLVRKFLETHPGSNILQVERATGIPRGKIAKMIEQDRFHVANANAKLDV